MTGDSQLGQATMFSQIKNHITKKADEIVSSKLSRAQYNINEAQSWTNIICDSILKELTNFNKNFKYIVNCLIMQKADCGLNISGSCYWDNEVDGSASIKWENNTLICIVNVYGCGL